MPTITARFITSEGVVGNALPMPIKNFGPQSYRAVWDSIAPAQNKYMALLFNTSTTYNVLVHRIYLRHQNITAATGVVLDMTLLRVSAFTTGTAITPVPLDPANTLPSGISADHNSSAVSDVSGSSLGRYVTTAEETALASTDVLVAARVTERGALIYESGGGIEPIWLRGATAAQRGIAIKNATNSTAGTMNFTIDFTVVAV